MSQVESLPAHRADVEGLRAVAILMVVAAHTGVPAMQGGFAGVDVFFVLSGFLISGLLLGELERNDRIALAAFYARRLRRLLPGLILMVLAVAAAAALLVAPGEQVGQADTAKSVPWWLSNMVFALTELDYFGGAADRQLFLHTWSLAVEEQFYLLWPLLLIVAWRHGARTGGDPWGAVERTMVLVFVSSLVLCLVLTTLHPAHAFFTSPARAWQFALGALVFLRKADIVKGIVALRPALSAVSPPLRLTVVGLAGAALLVVSLAVLGHDEVYPGLWAAIPSLGAALILAVGDRDEGPLGRLLASRPMQWMGRMSYGWYLWHWPLIVLTEYVDPAAEWPLKLLASALALLLAWLSFHALEQRIRYASRLNAVPGRVIVAAIACMSLGSGLMWFWQGQAQQWSREPEQRRWAAAKRDLPHIYRLGCDEWYHSARVRPCVLGGQSFNKTAVVLGDSVVLQWFDALSPVFPQPEWRVLVLTKSACPMVDERFFYATLGRPFFECEAWRLGVLEYLTTLRPDVVITGSGASYAIAPQAWHEGSQRVLNVIAANAGRVVVLQPNPVLAENPLRCLAREAWRQRLGWPDDVCHLKPSLAATRDERDSADRLAAEIPGVRVLDLSDLICAGEQCPAVRDHTVVYRDTQHLTARFVKRIAAEVGERLKALLVALPEAAPELEATTDAAPSGGT